MTAFGKRRRVSAALFVFLTLLGGFCTGCGSDAGKGKTGDTENTAQTTDIRVTGDVSVSEDDTAPVTDASGETEIIRESVSTERETKKSDGVKSTKTEETADILGLKTMRVGGKDYAGNKIVTVDVEEGLFISEIEGKTEDYHLTYRGYIMLIDDPARVFIGMTPENKKYGYSVSTLMKENGGAIAGCNASGFADPNECGGGNDIVGLSMAGGAARGNYIYGYPSIVLTKDNRLKCGQITDWKKENVRDGMQFGPTLLRDGKAVTDEYGGYVYGDHPRTAIGQRDDGAILFLIIDGRVEGWSAGCSVNELTKIMQSYGAETAGCCDGGSSCILVYGDAAVNRNSADNPEDGRLLPNAFLVKSKKTS